MIVWANAFLILGAIGAMFVTVLLYYHRQTLTVWTVFLTIVTFALAGCLYWQDHINRAQEGAVIEENNIVRNFAVPTFAQKPEVVTISVGDKNIVRKFAELEKTAYEPFIFENVKPLRIYVDQGSLFVDPTIFRDSTSPPVKIVRGNYDRIPTGWDINSNSESLEIVDDAQLPVFQVSYRSDWHVVVSGVFSHPHGVLIIDKLGTRDIKAEKENTVHLIVDWPESDLARSPHYDGLVISVPVKLPRLFKYPSWQFPGEVER